MKNDQRQIVAFMTFAVIFGLIGHTIKLKNQSSVIDGGDFKILLGGGLGTVLLVLLSEAGDPGETLAKGLAAITLIGSVLVNGTSVFTGVSKLSSKTTATNPAPHLVTTPKAA